jgi:hypothetical protein
MRINYDRVAEFMGNEEFKKKIRCFFMLDMEASAEGLRLRPVSVVYLAMSICLDEEPAPDYKMDDRELLEFLSKPHNQNYIAQLGKIILERPIKELLGMK